MVKRARNAALAVVAASLFAVAPSAAAAATYTVKTLHFDVVTGPQDDKHCDVVADLYKPNAATKSSPAPSILTTHGFGGSKDDQAPIAKLEASRGYVVLAYSGLGFGGSGCKITLDDRDYDGKAAKQLVSFLGGGKAAKDGTRVDYVRRDSVAHDRKHHANDPRVGMIGGSYGGQVQFAVAGIDPRVDALIPIITWNDLAYALAPNNTGFSSGVSYQTPGVEKYQWTSLFFGVGIADGITGGTVDPSRNVGCPNFDDRACGSKAEMDADGAPNDATILFARHASVVSFVKQIRIPTLLVQGQGDTLFNLQEAVATYRSLRKRNVPVKMIWEYGGHSGDAAPGEIDTDENGYRDPQRNYLTRTYLQWLDHWVAGSGKRPATNFTYFRDWVKYKGDATAAYAEALSYPIGTTRTYFLSGPNSLVDAPKQVSAGSATFTTPTAGGPTSFTETSAVDQSQPVTDAEGTFAQFATPPLTRDLDVIGVPGTEVSIAAPTHQAAVAAGGAPAALVLFFKLYELKPDGEIVLTHRVISPVRIADMSSPVRVELPGIVHRFKKGSRIALTVAASDAAYKGNNTSGPITISTSAANPGSLWLPVVPTVQQKAIGTTKLPQALPNVTSLANGLVRIPKPPGRCKARKTFRFHVRKRKGLRISSVAFSVNHERVKTVRGKAIWRTVKLRKLPRKGFRLGVVIHAVRNGAHFTIRDWRHYGKCQKRKGKNKQSASR